jgi:septum formation inhibitor-activating ATPase MinD
MGKAVAIVSGKGGRGKTTVSANLSVALAKRKMKTLAVDCDFEMQNPRYPFRAGADLGLFDFYDVCTKRVPFADAFKSLPEMERAFLHFGAPTILCRRRHALKISAK